LTRRAALDQAAMTAINVTPIIDVALVLVIILMITAPMLAVPQFGLELPEARTLAHGEENRVNVTLARDGRVAIEERVVPRESFVAALSARLAEGSAAADKLLIVRADAGVRYHDIRELLKEARGAGAARIAIATQPKRDGEKKAR
jgi:biopolymer transport protein ExbD